MLVRVRLAFQLKSKMLARVRSDFLPKSKMLARVRVKFVVFSKKNENVATRLVGVHPKTIIGKMLARVFAVSRPTRKQPWDSTFVKTKPP